MVGQERTAEFARIRCACHPVARKMVANGAKSGGRRMARGLRSIGRMEPGEARARLIAQHDQIRMHLARSNELARLVRAGEPLTADLESSLAMLRRVFAQHNEAEQALIKPLLHDSPTWGSLLVDRMLEEHLAEHAAFWEMLEGSPAEVAARMDDLVEELDAHMAAEERTFLSPMVLHPDTIARHRGPEPTK